MGALSDIPDLGAVTTSLGQLGGAVDGVSGALSGLLGTGSDSPLGAVFGGLQSLEASLNIDVAGLTEDLPDALAAVQSALPANTLEFLEQLPGVYSAVSNALADNDVVRAASEGSSLEQVALAALQQLAGSFSEHLHELAGGLVDAESLEATRTALTLVANLRDDFPAHQHEFLPFATSFLTGFQPDLLDAALAHRTASLAVLDAISPAALEASLRPAQNALVEVCVSLHAAIDGLDPSHAADYAAIGSLVTTFRTQTSAAVTALDGIYTGLSGALAGHDWSDLFATTSALLSALVFDDVLSLDDVVATIETVLRDVLTRVIGIVDLPRAEVLLQATNSAIRGAFDGSPIGEVRQILTDFLGKIRDTIAEVPTGQIQEAIDGVFERVQDGLGALHLDAIETAIDDAFRSLDALIADTFDAALLADVNQALAALAQQAEGLPIAELSSALSGAIDDLKTLVETLEAAVSSNLDQLRTLLQGLDSLSFRPLGDEIVGEIADLKTRVQSLNPNALSDVEKLALTAALALIRELDVAGKIAAEVKPPFHTAQAAVAGLLDQVAAALERLRDAFLAFDPATLLAPIRDVLARVRAECEAINAKMLLKPVHDQLDGLTARLQQLSPGSLLDPLQAPFDQLLTQLDRLNPDQWVTPLRDLYALIQSLIDKVDITPILDQLAEQQAALFAQAQSAVLSALQDLDLPPPLDAFFSELRPIIELVTEAIFGNPDTQLSQFYFNAQTQIRLSKLLEPLDAVFNDFVQLVEQIPPATLTGAFEQIRQALGTGVRLLNPQQISKVLHDGVQRLEALSPPAALRPLDQLATLELQFRAKAALAPPERAAEVAAVEAGFELSARAAQPTGTLIAPLIVAHGQLLGGLRSDIDALDATEATTQYQRLSRNMERLLPEFLRRAEPLDHAAVLGGIQALRPGSRIDRLDRLMAEFFARAEPLQAALSSTINDFFAAIRDVVTLMNPLSLRSSVEEIYTAIRQKVIVIDPDALSASIQSVLDQITAPIQAVNPAALKQRLDQSFGGAVAAITGLGAGVLDTLAHDIDLQLVVVRSAINAVLDALGGLLTAVGEAFVGVRDQLDNLVFVEILGRLRQVLDNLGMSFDAELDRVVHAFNDMLAAIPLGGSTGSSASISG